MGIIVSRYLDPSSSEGALVKFIIESLQLVRTLLTAETYFAELTPWNVIDFGGGGGRMGMGMDMWGMEEGEEGEVEFEGGEMVGEGCGGGVLCWV